MSEYDNLLSAVDKMELTDEQKKAILGPAKGMSEANGALGLDLKLTKDKIGGLEQQNQTYKEFSEALSKYNMSTADIKKLAEANGIAQTNKEALDEISNINKNLSTELSTAQEQLRVLNQEKVLGPTFDSAVKDFKVDGQSVDLKPSFLNGIKEDLYKGIKDGENEIVINSRINEALTKAYSNQAEFMKTNGLVSTDKPFHKVDENSMAASGQSNGINLDEQIKAFRDSGSTVNSAAAMIAKAHAGNQ